MRNPVVSESCVDVGRTIANIDETVLLVVITEQGENRNQCEEQRNLFGFPHGGRRCRLRFPWGGPRFLLSAASGLGTASISMARPRTSRQRKAASWEQYRNSPVTC